jgi:hypothetical protein
VTRPALESLQVHLGPDLAASVDLVLGPPRQARDDRQSAPCGSFGTEHKGVGLAAASGIPHAQGQSVLEELKLQFDPVASTASVQDCVRDELTRHDQDLLHALRLDPPPVECAS